VNFPNSRGAAKSSACTSSLLIGNTALPKHCSTRLNISPPNAGYEWLYLDSAPGMDTAIRFYQRSGYEPCPRYNNNPQANIYLRKRIR